jgi:hypothetical protein
MARRHTPVPQMLPPEEHRFDGCTCDRIEKPCFRCGGLRTALVNLRLLSLINLSIVHRRLSQHSPLQERINRILPALYLVWALPLQLTMAWLIPPWSNPDEPDHMLRIVELAYGELIGERFGPQDAGGLSNAAVRRAAAPLDPVKFHPERKVTLIMRSHTDQVPWDASSSVVAFAYTAPYPPVLYVPAVLTVRIGQMFGFHVNRTLLLARAATTLAAVVISTLALALARRSRYALAGMAILPMTCELNASVGQDALMIALTLLAVGWIDRIIEHGQPGRREELVGIALALAAVAMARPLYVTFALLPMLTTARLRWSNSAAACFVVIMVGIWSTLVATTVLIVHSDASVQAQSLFAHPLRFVMALTATLRLNIFDHARELVGQLGWLDTSVPLWYTWLALFVIAASFVAAADGTSRYPWLAGLAAIGGATLVFAIQYISWTRPDSAVIDGVQGRYFIPPMAVAVLAVGSFRRVGQLARPVALAGLGTLAITTPFVIVQALVVRYYLGA